MSEEHAYNEPESWDSIESMVRDARCYVNPTSDLRPKIMDEARQRSKVRRDQWQLGGWMLFLLMLFQFGIFLSRVEARAMNSLESRLPTAAGANVQTRAARNAQSHGFDASGGSLWALPDAFAQYRKHDATLPR